LTLALGHSVNEVHDLYKKNVVKVMACETAVAKTASLKALAVEVFEEQRTDGMERLSPASAARSLMPSRHHAPLFRSSRRSWSKHRSVISS
jgi:hypothetical protein